MDSEIIQSPTQNDPKLRVVAHFEKNNGFENVMKLFMKICETHGNIDNSYGK
jgi:hypothetical protein